MIKIYHDPGHGGTSLGAVRDGVAEKDLVLSIVVDVVGGLAPWGFASHMMSRHSDITIPYADRARDAAAWGADLVICYHADSRQLADGTDDEFAGGLQTYAILSQDTAFHTACQIQRCAPRNLRSDRLIPRVARPSDWTANTYGLIMHYNPIPTLVIELGFMTNPSDLANMQDFRQRPSICATIMCGITRLLEVQHGT